MAKSANRESNDKYRAEVLKKIMALFAELGEDVQQTATNKFCFPFVNEAQSDEWIEVTVSVPLGSTKDKTPFDGYEQAQDYKAKVIKDEATAKEAQAKKEKDIERDKVKREIAKKKKEAE